LIDVGGSTVLVGCGDVVEMVLEEVGFGHAVDSFLRHST
jgi:hypothetical protein